MGTELSKALVRILLRLGQVLSIESPGLTDTYP